MAMAIGVDSHKETLAACAVDEIGRQDAAAEFPNSRPGHTALLDWALQSPGDHVFAIEGSGGFGSWVRWATFADSPPRTTSHPRLVLPRFRLHLGASAGIGSTAAGTEG
jgi:Transposase